MWYEELSKLYNLPVKDAVVDIDRDGDIYIEKGDRKYYIGCLSYPEGEDWQNTGGHDALKELGDMSKEEYEYYTEELTDERKEQINKCVKRIIKEHRDLFEAFAKEIPLSEVRDDRE